MSRFVNRMAVLCLVMLAGVTSAAAAPACATSATLYNPCEITRTAATSASVQNHYTYFTSVTATFRHVSTNRSYVIHGFYDQFTTWRFRFTPTLTGAWRYSVTSTPADSGLAVAESAATEIFVNDDGVSVGFLRRDNVFSRSVIWDRRVGTQTVHDQHPLLWGQTYYQMINNARHPERSADRWKQAIDESMQYGINKFRVLLYPWWGDDPFTPGTDPDPSGFGIYNDTQPYLDAAQADGIPKRQFPNRNRLRFEHWRKFDEMVEYMAARKAVVEIIIFHDRALDTADTPITGRVFGTIRNADGTVGDTSIDERYARYAVARYGSYPNVYFSLSNEWTATKMPASFWRTIGQRVKATDAYFRDPSTQRFRLLTIHDNNDRVFDTYVNADLAANGGWVSSISQQYSFRNPEQNLVPDAWTNDGIAANLHLGIPVVNDEFGYIGEHKTTTPAFGPFVDPLYRQAQWGVAIAGGYGTVGDWNTTVSGSTASLSADWLYQPEYEGTKHLVNFFKTHLQNHFRMNRVAPSSINLVKPSTARVYILAETNAQYAFYKAGTGAPFTVTLPVRTWTIATYDPRTGQIVHTTTSPGGSGVTIGRSVDANADWAYVVK